MRILSLWRRQKLLLLSVVVWLWEHTQAWMIAHRSGGAFRTTTKWGSALAEDPPELLFDEDDDNDNDDANHHEPHQHQQQQHNYPELWLDLRGTALSPQEALTFLQEFIQDDPFLTTTTNAQSTNDTTISTTSSSSPMATPYALHDIVEGILVSQEQIRVSSSLGQRILYDNGQGDLQELTHENSSSSHYPIVGKIVTPDQNGFVDPLAILDMDEQQQDSWIMIDTTSRTWEESGALDDTTWTDQVAGFLQFVTATRFMPSSSSSSMILTNDNNNYDNNYNSVQEQDTSASSSSSTTHGGIAMTCPTHAGLFFADRSLAQQRFLLQDTLQTESGILLTEQETFDDDDDDDDTTTNTDTKTHSLATALVIPLDLRLWKAALELRQTNSN